MSLSLVVREMRPKDAGRALARLDPADLRRIGADVGDVVRVRGKRETHLKAMPSFPEDRGRGAIHMDGVARANASVAVDEPVDVEKVDAPPLASVAFRFRTAPRTASPLVWRRFLLHALDGAPLSAGDAVRADAFGAAGQLLDVTRAEPPFGVLVRDTRLDFEGGNGAATPASTRGRVTYEDIGGLRGEVHRIREMLELPLRHPEVFERVGIDPPKGVLLHGPPGTGKTLIARAVAHESEAAFFSINGPEIIHKHYGESEAKLRQVFEEAERKAPSIIFLDEIDAIAPKREETTGDVEKRVVAQLLALLDGLHARGNVIVIGATNIPNALDPALRRAGRFDREIEIPIPNRDDRLEILSVHTRGMPLATDVSLERLAAVTHGYVGSDLAALCREAAMACLRDLLPELDRVDRAIAPERLVALEVRMEHFLEGLREVQPTAIREVEVEVPNVRWSDVGGLDAIKQEVAELIEWPLKFPAAFAHARTKPPRGIVLHGAPGTGKTLLARAIATETEANFISVKGPELLSKWVGESEKAVREIFKKARQAAPCVLFFDELDALAPARGSLAGDRVQERVVAQLLTEMDGLEELRNVVVLGATNRLDLLDPALLRPGRFAVQIEVPLPDEAGRAAVFAVHLRGRPLAPDVDPARLARETPGLSGADVEDVVRRGSLGAIRRFLRATGGLGEPDFVITAADIMEAIMVSRRIRNRDDSRERTYV